MKTPIAYKASIRTDSARLPAACVFLFLLLMQAGCSSHLVVRGGAVNPDKLEDIKNGVVAFRGLGFKRQVPIEVKSKAEMRRHLEADLQRHYSEEKLRNMALAYSKLGLLPEEVDLKNLLVEFYDAQVVAFYDPDEKKLVLPESLSAGMVMNAVQLVSRRDVLGEMVLAHELTHALQDQHFSIGEKLRPSKDDDQSLAWRALIEGDATLTGFGFVLGEIDDNKLATIQHLLQGSMDQARSSLAHLPEAIVESMLFQYHGGLTFVSRLFKERGWTGVNALYSAPPLSSEQLLHPEKFFEAPDPPTAIELPDLAASLGPEWSEIENDTLGELMVRVLLRRFLPEDDARRAAAGWDGDRFVAFRSGDEMAFLWVSVWDSSDDAEEFVDGFSEVLRQKYSGTDSGNTYLERREAVATVVEGFHRSQIEEWIEKLWEGIRFVERRPALSFAPPPQGTTVKESGL
ncbi:MAG: hypothetical protein ACREQK_15400 [Candidatus Binatia bacterium]